MGHTIAEWRTKVLALVRDTGNRDITSASEVDAVGIRPALARFSVDRPCELVTEVAGAGSEYFALPDGWVAGYSRLTAVEYPARSSTAAFLDGQSWGITRDPVTVASQKVRLAGYTPAASEWVRFWFTGPWPFPTDDVDDDLVDDVAFEAVAALAASLVETSLASEAARNRRASLATDVVMGEQRARELRESAKVHRGMYEAFLGYSTDGDNGTGGSSAPVSRSMDFDSQYRSMFHGGRR